jgi:uncharacterized protein with HEPN domain
VKDDRKYLLHIAECIRRIEEDIASGRPAFDQSHLIQDAVLRNLQVIAESTKRLSDSFKASAPEINWREIAGFRNFLVHDYLGVDLDIVWKVVEQDLPQLKRAIERNLRNN